MKAISILALFFASLMSSATAIKMKSSTDRHVSPLRSQRPHSFSSASSSSAKDCSLELQGILYKPPNCAREYLERVARILPTMDVATFQSIYPDIVLYLISETGSRYFFLNGIAYASLPNLYTHSMAQANLNFGGFDVSPADGYAYYTYTAQDRSGIFYYVSLSIATSHVPVVCGNGCQI